MYTINDILFILCLVGICCLMVGFIIGLIAGAIHEEPNMFRKTYILPEDREKVKMEVTKEIFSELFGCSGEDNAIYDDLMNL